MYHRTIRFRKKYLPSMHQSVGESTRGIVEYEGKNLLDKKCDIRKFREEVGMVFQRFNLFP